MQDITIEGERFRLQRVNNAIKTIGDRSTLMLGYLVIVMATLASFVFVDFGAPVIESESANQFRILATVLLALYAANTSIFLGIIIASLETRFVDEPETLQILKEKITANIQKLNALTYWYRFSVIFAFAVLVAVCGFAIYSLL